MRLLLILTAMISALALTQCRDGNSDGDGDGDGDSDGDGDGDSDGDGDGDVPCFPALGVCDPVNQCGCPDPTPICSATILDDGGTAEVCQEDMGGRGVHDELCDGACAAGFLCRNTADAEGNPIQVCAKWCLDDSDCSDYPGSLCNAELAYEFPDGSIHAIEPYKLCTPEDVRLAAGTAAFSVCTGRTEDCPGGAVHEYEIGGGGITGSCEIVTTSPMELTFSLYDEAGGVSLTASRIQFTPSGDDFAVGSSLERGTRFSLYLEGGRNFSTATLASPPTEDTCDIRVQYNAAEEAFAAEFTCNHIDDSFTDDRLVTIVAGAMGPGTVAMGGCLISEE